jgi:hypothetical protein
MRTWDIVDVLESNSDVVSTRPNPSAFRALITSAAQVAFVVTLAVASTAQFTLQKSGPASTLGAKVRFADSSQFVQRQDSLLRQRVVSDSDTQFGQSTVKLAQLFETYFAPAGNEEPFEDDYSFS